MPIAVGGKVRTKIVRAAATIGIAAVEDSLGVPCFSARQVGFLLTAADANVLASAVVQVGNNNVNFTTVDTSGFGVDDIGTVTVALDVGGRWLLLVPNGAASTGRFPFCNPWFHARVRATGGGIATAGLKIDAFVWDDLDFAMVGVGLPPAVVS